MLMEGPSVVPMRGVRAGQAAETPIGYDAVLRCFAGLDVARGLLLAVSGGPDSMALLLMATRWAERLGAAAPPINVATVDHGLRPAARAEAEMVAAVSSDLDLPHAILTWTGTKPSTRVQEKARQARYSLLAARASAIGASHILTAHHADDQAETVLMRLGRGSGITGLAGMRRLSPLPPDLILVRPFLALTKAQLVAICRGESCDYIEDPSNRDRAFTRARLRSLNPVLADLGLNNRVLLRLARRMARADAALEAETDRLETFLAPERGSVTYRVDLAAADAIASEIAERLLGRAVGHVATRPVHLERLEALTEALWQALSQGQQHRATLAGTRVVLDKDRVLTISAEMPRRRGLGGSQIAMPSALRPN